MEEPFFWAKLKICGKIDLAAFPIKNRNGFMAYFMADQFIFIGMLSVGKRFKWDCDEKPKNIEYFEPTNKLKLNWLMSSRTPST